MKKFSWQISVCRQLCHSSWRLILGSCFLFFSWCICILSWHNVRSVEIHEGIWSKHSWLLQGSYRGIKVYLHCAKVKVKTKYFLWFLSLLSVNIKLDSLWTHLEATSFRRTFRPTRLKVYSAWRFVHSKAILGDLWWRFHNGRIVLNVTTTSFESVVFVSGINGINRLDGKTDHDLFTLKCNMTSQRRHSNLRLWTSCYSYPWRPIW